MKAFELLRAPFTAVSSISRVTFQTNPELSGISVTKLFAYSLSLLIRDWQKALRTIMMVNSTPYLGCVDNFCCVKLEYFCCCYKLISLRNSSGSTMLSIYMQSFLSNVLSFGFLVKIIGHV